MEIRCLLDIRQEILNRPTIRNNLLSVYESIKKLHVGETWTLVSPSDLSLFVREYGFYMKASEFTDTYQVERYHWRPDSPEAAIPTRYCTWPSIKTTPRSKAKISSTGAIATSKIQKTMT